MAPKVKVKISLIMLLLCSRSKVQMDQANNLCVRVWITVSHIEQQSLFDPKRISVDVQRIMLEKQNKQKTTSEIKLFSKVDLSKEY